MTMDFDSYDMEEIMNAAFGHAKTVCTHKYWVAKYCFKLGLYWRGVKHDFSKFSPTEFIESAKYYMKTRGKKSPIDAAKKDKGWSSAWLHHKGRNDHHYEYWQDNFDTTRDALDLPFECAAELICDYLGAGRAYMGNNFTYLKEYEWWISTKYKKLAMHPHIMEFVNLVMIMMARAEVTIDTECDPSPWQHFTMAAIKDLYYNTDKYMKREKERKYKPELDVLGIKTKPENKKGIKLINGKLDIPCTNRYCDNCNPDDTCMYGITQYEFDEYLQTGKIAGGKPCAIIQKALNAFIDANGRT